jgi:hypothetical protein
VNEMPFSKAMGDIFTPVIPINFIPSSMNTIEIINVCDRLHPRFSKMMLVFFVFGE